MTTRRGQNRRRRRGRRGARTCPSASGGRCARTTSADGDAWNSFTHDQARSRAYRWGEDGIAGVSRRAPAAVPRARAVERRGPDPQGAHLRAHQQRGQPRRGREGVLVLPRLHAHALVHEVRSTSTRSGRSRTRDLVDQTAARHASDPELRAARHRRVRRGPLLRRRRRVREGRAGRHPDAGHGAQSRAGGGDAARAADAVVSQHLARRVREAVDQRDGVAVTRARRVALRDRRAAALLRERDATARTRRSAINDHVVARRADRPRQTGTKCAAHHVLEVPAGGSAMVRVRLSATARARRDFDAVFAARRRAEADAFYAKVIPPALDADRALVMRQALAGLLWTKQFYEYDVHRWLREHGVNPWDPDAARASATAVVPHARRRRDLDAGQVGVPVVRGLGPGLPLRAAVARRRRLRQGAGRAAPAHALHAPQRADPGLRVELLRRQPARDGVGGAVGLPSARPRSAARATARC